MLPKHREVDDALLHIPAARQLVTGNPSRIVLCDVGWPPNKSCREPRFRPHRRKSVLGTVYQPVREVLYRAVRGGGSWIEEKTEPARRMTVSSRTNPNEMVLASSRSHRSPRMERVVSTFQFKDEVRRGSVGVKIGLITEQQADLYLHLSPSTKQWDTCGPEIILQEAGGRLTDLFGQPLRYNGIRIDNRNGIVATNGAAHEMVIEKLKPLLREFGRAPV